MNLRDSLEGLRDFWKEFYKVKSGVVGVILLLIFIVLAFIGPAIVPFPGATEKWRDINFWKDNPTAAPPAWTNWLAKKKGAVSLVLPAAQIEEQDMEGLKIQTASFVYNYTYDLPPRDITVRFRGSGQTVIKLAIERPDGLIAELTREQLELNPEETQRVSLGRNCMQAAIEFVRGQDADLASNMNAQLVKPITILLSKLDPMIETSPNALKGDYKITITALALSEGFKLEEASVMIAGQVSGVFGTDMGKRDVFTGIIIGIRWALIIGMLTSIITVTTGVLLGVIAAYFGGTTDWILTRIFELVNMMPVLPFLIVMSAVFKPNIWTLITLICLFFWTGAFKPVYSMTLQIKEETYIEASKALGSSKWRIVFKHIVPILLPYAFAVMALTIPGVIVYESTVSLLGLGDPTVVTWGQILRDANSGGAVINSLWWWVIPPGLMIAVMGMSFAFLGTALDKILHPKLKTR